MNKQKPLGIIQRKALGGKHLEKQKGTKLNTNNDQKHREKGLKSAKRGQDEAKQKTRQNRSKTGSAIHFVQNKMNKP